MSSVYCRLLNILANFSNLFFCLQANSVDPDQTAPWGAVWSGSTQFAKMTFTITSRWQCRRQLLWLAVFGLKFTEVISSWWYGHNGSGSVKRSVLRSWAEFHLQPDSNHGLCDPVRSANHLGTQTLHPDKREYPYTCLSCPWKQVLSPMIDNVTLATSKH